jgi:uncharacterized RDD family membrane protein YckC
MESASTMRNCPECGTGNPPGMSFCRQCGRVFEVEVAPKQKDYSYVFAGFWSRFIALFIDGIVLMVLDYAIGLLALVTNSSLQQEVVYGFGLIIGAVYYVWPYSRGGQTLGKAVLGIRVASIDGTPLNWRMGLQRYLGYFVSAFSLLIGYLWAIWDGDKQAWHDKLAGTIVVKASTSPGDLKPIDPEVARRRQRRWSIGLGIPAVLITIAAGFGVWSLTQAGIAEVDGMGPWPGGEISTEAAITVDLSHLELVPDLVLDARVEETCSEGAYEEGSVAKYYSAGEAIVGIWGLKYDGEASASKDYQMVAAWANENCAQSFWSNIGSTGFVHCESSDTYDAVFWKGPWIINIVASDWQGMTAEGVVGKVRDSLSAHWSELKSP